MDTFKTKPGISEEILITEENFAQRTKKRFPYYTTEKGIIQFKSLACIKEKKILQQNHMEGIQDLVFMELRHTMRKII